MDQPELRGGPFREGPWAATPLGLDPDSSAWRFVWPPDGIPAMFGSKAHPGKQPLPLQGFDIFGYPRNRWKWHVGGEVAWDVFGFRIFVRKAPVYAKVMVEEIHFGHRLSEVTTGLVFYTYQPTRRNWAICEVTNVQNPNINVWGVRILASVRAVRHWVSRWRRGLRVLRKRQATMVLALKLPEAPEILVLVHDFL